MSVSTTFSTVYSCDSDSVIKQLSQSGTATINITCNGVIVDGPSDLSYDVIYNKHGKWGNGNWASDNCGSGNWGTKQTLNLTNYTEVFTINNGIDINQEIK